MEPLSDGFFGLDGGAMFGVVPRVLWRQKNPPDANNRILLALRPLLIRTGDAVVVVDTGVGDKYGPKFNEMFNVDHRVGLRQSLADHGVEPEAVTHVVLTHLHFDHAGGATRLDPAGRPVPTFPNARHLVQEQEWHDATHPNRRTRGSYREDDFRPLQAAGLVELIDGDVEPLPGIRLVRTGGHTRGHQIVLVESSKQFDVYWADLVPTTTHLNVPYIMGYDLYPLETMDCKEAMLGRAADEGWTCWFEHDPAVAAARVAREGDRFAVEKAIHAVPQGENDD
ncbi:MBL fold metallo-hydrolase [candidate division WOR-3 bacterium]|nr:MBL fold metallo-hydrolase [candidate division WOR-3 bacterium]